MGQKEILDWLERRDGWYSTAEIADAFALSRTSTATCLRKLRSDGLVWYKKGQGKNRRGLVYARMR